MRKKPKSQNKAVWLPDPADLLRVKCSGCGFTVETIRAVETGWTASEHMRVKYRFCPMCGRAMSVYNQE